MKEFSKKKKAWYSAKEAGFLWAESKGENGEF